MARFCCGHHVFSSSLCFYCASVLLLLTAGCHFCQSRLSLAAPHQNRYRVDLLRSPPTLYLIHEGLAAQNSRPTSRRHREWPLSLLSLYLCWYHHFLDVSCQDLDLAPVYREVHQSCGWLFVHRHRVGAPVQPAVAQQILSEWACRRSVYRSHLGLPWTGWTWLAQPSAEVAPCLAHAIFAGQASAAASHESDQTQLSPQPRWLEDRLSSLDHPEPSTRARAVIFRPSLRAGTASYLARSAAARGAPCACCGAPKRPLSWRNARPGRCRPRE